MTDEADTAVGEVEAEAKEPEKKGFQFPSTMTVLVIVTFLVCLAAFLIPAGTYQHDENGVPQPGAYPRIASPQLALTCALNGPPAARRRWRRSRFADAGR